VPSPWIAVDWDAGNSYLAGAEDPYEALTAVRPHVRHVHAKDIDFTHADAERGKVTGTPVGCACGDGVVDWDRVIEILDPLDRDITLSVECGTVDQAARSLRFLQGLLAGRLADG
jgi:sugar phosphate isomerase/epimerase